MSVIERFIDRLRRRLRGLEPGGVGETRVLVGVSGGADSVALLRGLLLLRHDLGCEIRVAHLNHRLRGTDADGDAEWVRSLCSALDVPVTVSAQDVRDLAEASAAGIEETARRARYDFLARTAAEHGCPRVAVGHTADDQAETILHHVIRGTGLSGLRGMPVSRQLGEGIVLIRPLLAVSRADVAAFLTELGQDWRGDASNIDPAFTRNRLRHELLPLLRRDFNPQVDEALRRLGEQAGEAQAVLEMIADRLLDEALVQPEGAGVRGQGARGQRVKESKSQRDKEDAPTEPHRDSATLRLCDSGAPEYHTPPTSVCRLDCRPLSGQSRHLIRVCLSRLWERLGWPRQGLGFDQWERLAELVLSEGAESLPGPVEARRRGSLLVLCRG